MLLQWVTSHSHTSLYFLNFSLLFFSFFFFRDTTSYSFPTSFIAIYLSSSATFSSRPHFYLSFPFSFSTVCGTSDHCPQLFGSVVFDRSKSFINTLTKQQTNGVFISLVNQETKTHVFFFTLIFLPCICLQLHQFFPTYLQQFSQCLIYSSLRQSGF